jgi:hypothetical protein
MVNESFCTYAGNREEVLISYLYGEIAADDRAAFDRHLTTCARCRTELHALGGVREHLSRWTSPEPAGAVVGAFPRERKARSVSAAIRELPAWTQFTAAALLLGAAAGLANIRVAYDATGLMVRTGWLPAPAAPAVSTTNATAPWRNDLMALERQVNAVLEMRAASADVAAPPAAAAHVARVSNQASDQSSGDAIVQRMNALIAASERRQQSELALRVAEVMRAVHAQRQADLVKIDQNLEIIQNRTGMEVLKTQRQVDTLARQVSLRP